MNRFQTPGGGMRFGGMGLTPAIKGLLIANVAVFMLQNLFSSNSAQQLSFIDYWGVYNTSAAVFHYQIWRFLSYMFLHGSFSHILFNMFGLWMFGTQIEARWGRKNFLIYYFVCGLGGSVLYGIFDLVGIGGGGIMLGASAGVFGILLAYGMTFPNNILLIGFIFPMKAKYAVILFGLIELMATASSRGDGIAHLAHLGGMLAGFIFMTATMPNIRQQVGDASGGLGGYWRRLQTKRKIRVVPPQPKPGNGSSQDQSKPRSADQKEIDGILDKISRNGLQSLSDEEQEILRRAGRR